MTFSHYTFGTYHRALAEMNTREGVWIEFTKARWGPHPQRHILAFTVVEACQPLNIKYLALKFVSRSASVGFTKEF